MSDASRPINVAIAGGGVAGLSLARGLTKCPNLTVTVYESTAKYLDIGAGLALHANAIRAFELIDPELQAEYYRRATPMSERDVEVATEVRIGDVPGEKGRGQLLAELGKAKGRKTISRSELLEGLLTLLPEDTVQFGKRLIRIEERDGGIELAFKDGSTARADVLIGCDGVHSVTRTYLLGADHPAVELKNHDGWVWYKGDVAAGEVIDKDPSLQDSVNILCGHGAFVIHFPMYRRQELNVAVMQIGKQAGSTPTRLYANQNINGNEPTDTKPAPLDLQDFANWSQHARTLVEMVAHGTVNEWQLADHDPAPFYARGNIAMIGDAAHATMPFNGQGAGQSIEDATVLTALFREVKDLSEVEAALKAYEAARITRSQKVVELARQFGRMYAFSEEGVGDNVGKLMKTMGEGARYTNDIDLVAQNEEALRIFKSKISNGTV